MILVALGSNLPSKYGDSKQTLHQAVQEIAKRGIKVLRISKIYSTAPVPVSDQPWFKNAVMSVETDRTSDDLLKTLQEIEKKFGPKPRVRNGKRVLDLDLLAYKREVKRDALMDLPHPRMHQRGFVLYPLQDIAPEWIHPVLGLSVEEMIKRLPADQVLSRKDLIAA